MKIKPNNGNKQINAKNAANQNKGNKNRRNLQIILVTGPGLRAIDRKIHIIGPSFQSRQNEKTDETVENIIVVDVVVNPLRICTRIFYVIGVALLFLNVVESGIT